ncbi:MAG TPA: hypothetical protein VIL97_09645 [Thermoanaerobaculia bacterium]
MRNVFRISLLVLTLVSLTSVAQASHLIADCPLSLVGEGAIGASFGTSPHGVFRNGTVVYLLRGQTLTTLNVTDLGDVQVARQDTMSSLAARESQGGTAYSNGFLFLSGEGGLEVFDLRNVRGGIGGNAPISLARIAGLHYRRLAVRGNLLVGLYPATDLPCVPSTTSAPLCVNSIDIFSIADITNPVLVGRINSSTTFGAFNAVAFANGFLYATGTAGTFAWDLTNPAFPVLVMSDGTQGTFLITNGTNLLGIGQETLIGVFTIGPASRLNWFNVFTLPSTFDRANRFMFHPEAWFDDTRLITMIDEKDPLTGGSARTIAFDVFDFSVPFFEGADDRIYESVTYTYPDEVKHDPVAVGPFIHVIGEVSGAQIWGACGQMAGAIQFDTVAGLPCGGAEIRGSVTGAQRITSVEVFLDGTSLGTARLATVRTDTSSPTPVQNWAISVNLDQTLPGSHVLRAVARDAAGNTRQFATKTLFFPGPGSNCTTRRRGGKR